MSSPPSSSTAEGILSPLQVNLHNERPTKALITAIMTTEVEKEKIIREDTKMDIVQIPWPQYHLK